MFLLLLLYHTSKLHTTLAMSHSSLNSIPEARFGHSMVYNSVNKKIFLFGGTSDTLYQTSKNDLWMFDYATNNWTELTPTTSPARRLNFAMAHDSDSQRSILFGGNSITAGWELDDTWIYDYQTNEWTDINPSNKPPGRSDHAMAYDPVTKQTILFGGMRDVGDTTYILNDTWAYDYESNNWTELNPILAPNKRYGTRMAYNSFEEKIVLFGGGNLGGEEQDGKLWAFDAVTTTWEPLGSTEARYWYGLCYDTHQNEVIVFGGTILEPEIIGQLRNDTLVYDFETNQWTDVSKEIRPTSSSLQSLVYDQENRKAVVFGGWNHNSGEILDEVWILDTVTKEWLSLNASSTSTSGNSIDSPTNLSYSYLIVGFLTSVAIIKRKSNQK